MTFAIGDVVILVSGSPRLTVTGKPDDEGYVECSWFVTDSSGNYTGNCEEADFHPESLRKV